MTRKILFVLKDFPSDGGVEKVSLNLAYQFKREGHFVSFFVMDGTSIPKELYKDFDIYSGNRTGLIGMILLCSKLFKWIKLGQYTAVIAAKEQANILTYIVSLVYSPFTPIYTRHCSFSVDDQCLSAKNIQRLYRIYGKGRGKIVAVSEDLANYIKQQIPSIRNQVYFCPNPVVCKELFDKSEINSENFSHPRPYFCAVGRLCEQKGFDLLLRSYAKALILDKNLPDLIIVGSGELKGQLRALADKISINDKIKFHGFSTNPYFIVKHAELFLLSSKNEGLPTVLIEALALKQKIVAFDCPTGPREILREGKFGALVPAQNIELFAESIVNTFNSKLAVPNDATESYTYSNSAASYLSLMN
ncbi:MAG: hypothetical protein OFPI_00410 [Osedax symbiont Rs2]|nr:MAG: hypothetical protein OFPI_00410 [Osedax symbiont Rs2]